MAQMFAILQSLDEANKPDLKIPLSLQAPDKEQLDLSLCPHVYENGHYILNIELDLNALEEALSQKAGEYGWTQAAPSSSFNNRENTEQQTTEHVKLSNYIELEDNEAEEEDDFFDDEEDGFYDDDNDVPELKDVNANTAELASGSEKESITSNEPNAESASTTSSSLGSGSSSSSNSTATKRFSVFTADGEYKHVIELKLHINAQIKADFVFYNEPGSRFIRGRANFTENKNSQPFLLQYDAIVLCFIVKFNDYRCITLYSDFLLCASNDAEENENINQILSELTEIDNEYILDLMFANQQHQEEKSQEDGNHSDYSTHRAYKSLNSYVSLLDSILECYKNNFISFRALARHIIVKKYEVLPFDKVRSITHKSHHWLSQNLDVLMAVKPGVGALEHNHTSYLPLKMQSEVNKKSYDTFENRVVVGFLRMVLHNATKIYNDYHSRISLHQSLLHSGLPTKSQNTESNESISASESTTDTAVQNSEDTLRADSASQTELLYSAESASSATVEASAGTNNNNDDDAASAAALIPSASDSGSSSSTSTSSGSTGALSSDTIVGLPALSNQNGHYTLDEQKQSSDSSYQVPIIKLKYEQLGLYHSALERLQQLIGEFNEVYRNYAKLFNLPNALLESFPRKAKAFQELKPYAQVFQALTSWFHYGDFSLEKDMLFLNVKTLDKIFEYYCLYRLLGMLMDNGFKPQEHNAAYTFTYHINDNIVENDQFVANTYNLVRGKQTVTVYYQPIISTSKFENGIYAYRTTRISTRNSVTMHEFNFYCPDFILRFNSGLRPGDDDYLIFDAKFSHAHTIINQYISPLYKKYGMETSIAVFRRAQIQSANADSNAEQILEQEEHYSSLYRYQALPDDLDPVTPRESYLYDSSGQILKREQIQEGMECYEFVGCKVPKMIFALQGRINRPRYKDQVQKNRGKIWFFHNAPSSHKFPPSTSVGVIEINTKNNSTPILWKEIMRNLPYLQGYNLPPTPSPSEPQSELN